MTGVSEISRASNTLLRVQILVLVSVTVLIYNLLSSISTGDQLFLNSQLILLENSGFSIMLCWNLTVFYISIALHRIDISSSERSSILSLDHGLSADNSGVKAYMILSYSFDFLS